MTYQMLCAAKMNAPRGDGPSPYLVEAARRVETGLVLQSLPYNEWRVFDTRDETIAMRTFTASKALAYYLARCKGAM